jgi:hypothetical protein
VRVSRRVIMTGSAEKKMDPSDGRWELITVKMVASRASAATRTGSVNSSCSAPCCSLGV